MHPINLRRRLRHALSVTLFACGIGRSGGAAPSELPPEIGYNAGEVETPRSAAMGGAVRAFSNSSDALYANPANMAATRVYHLGGVAQIWPQARRQSYGAAAVDSVVNKQRIAGGVGATWNKQDADGIDRSGFDFRFGLAAPLSDQFFFGGALRYLSLAQNGYPRPDGLRPSAASGGLKRQEILADLTFDAGLTLKLAPELAISLVGQNLTDSGHGLLPLMLGGGVGYGDENFSIEADVVSDFSSYDEAQLRAMGGLEILLADEFPVRAGYTYVEGEGTHAASGGLGYLTREFSIDASLRALVEGPKSLTLVFGFKYHADAAGLVGGP